MVRSYGHTTVHLYGCTMDKAYKLKIRAFYFTKGILAYTYVRTGVVHKALWKCDTIIAYSSHFVRSVFSVAIHIVRNIRRNNFKITLKIKDLTV